MRIAFRTDASLDIGTGHVMRCLTLADALRASGAHCLFICRAHAGNLAEEIRRRGHVCVSLPAPRLPFNDVATKPTHAAWLGADWQTDAKETLVALAEQRMDWVIVDHYALDANWEAQLRPVCRGIMAIDDLADRPHDCEVLLDQTLGRSGDAYDNLLPEHCVRLIGPDYALLRPEFAAMRADSLARRENPRLHQILISMGGVDQHNATGRVLGALAECRLPGDCELTVVMGQRAVWLDAVQAQARTMPWVTTVKVNVHDMAQLMAENDLAIGAAGTTAWERCCLGLPTIVMVLANNQRAGAAALQRAGAALLQKDVEMLNETLPPLIDALGETARLRDLSMRSAQVTDGTGAARVTEELLNAHLG